MRFVVQDVIEDTKVMLYETRHDVDSGSTSTSAETTRRPETHTRDENRREDTLVD